MRVNWVAVFKTMIPCGILTLAAGAGILFYRGVFSRSLPNSTLNAILMVVCYLGMILVAVGVLAGDRAKTVENRRIASVGVPAIARIVKTEQRGYYKSGGTSEALLTLEIQGPDGHTFTAKATVFVGGGKAALALPPGSWVQVHYDPENPTRATLR